MSSDLRRTTCSCQRGCANKWAERASGNKRRLTSRLVSRAAWKPPARYASVSPARANDLRAIHCRSLYFGRAEARCGRAPAWPSGPECQLRRSTRGGCSLACPLAAVEAKQRNERSTNSVNFLQGPAALPARSCCCVDPLNTAIVYRALGRPLEAGSLLQPRAEPKQQASFAPLRCRIPSAPGRRAEFVLPVSAVEGCGAVAAKVD